MSKFNNPFKSFKTKKKIANKVEGWLYYNQYNPNIDENFFDAIEKNSMSPVLVDINHDLGDRYFFQLISFFAFAGHPILIHTIHPDDYFTKFEYSRIIYSFKNIFIVHSLPKSTENYILCTDHDSEKLFKNKWKKIISLNLDVSLKRDAHKKALLFPYPMHPVVYKLKQHEHLNEYRNNESSMRILFSGMQIIQPNEDIHKKAFNQPSRIDVIAFLNNYPHIQFFKKTIKANQLKRNSKTKHPFVVFDSVTAKIPQSEWLKSISCSDFFIAIPRDDRPMCHHIIEAMAVGTIPITNYAHWFHPALVDNVNCFTFDSIDSLDVIIKKVLDLDPAKITKMKQAVIHYYEQFLSPESIINKLIMPKNKTVEVFLNTNNQDILSKINEESVAISQQERINPTITIIIPTFNRCEHLRRALKSVFSQSFQNFECLVINDASTDATDQIINEFKDKRLRIIKHPLNKGCAAARNVGIKEAKGSFIAFLDDDDEFLPYKLEKQLHKFQNTSETVGCVYGGALVIDASNESVNIEQMPKWRGHLQLELLTGALFGSVTKTLIKKECFDKVGGFDELLKSCQDWDMWLRIANYYTFDYVPEVLVYIFIHPTQLSNTFKTLIAGRERMLEKYRTQLKLYPNILANHFLYLAKLHFLNGTIGKGINFLIKSLFINPSQFFKMIAWILFAFPKINRGTKKSKIQYLNNS